MIEFISTIAGIIFILTFISYVKHNQNKMIFISTILEDHEAEIKTLKATIQKDREKIADYLNELTKNSNE